MDAETAVTAFFRAMNAQDGDAATALVTPAVEIVLGPGHVLVGQESVRGLAVQEDPELVFETVPLSFETEGDVVRVTARREQRWRESGEVAVEEELHARFVLDPAGLIARVELS